MQEKCDIVKIGNMSSSVDRSVSKRRCVDMDKRQITTIMYLIASLALFLLAILAENPLLGPIDLLFLILGGFHSQARNERGY